MAEIKKAKLIDAGDTGGTPVAKVRTSGRLPLVIAGAVVAGFIAGFAVGGVAGAALAWRSGATKPAAISPPKGVADSLVEGPVVEDEGLVNLYNANPVAAEAKYLGRRVRMTITAETFTREAGKVVLGHPTVMGVHRPGAFFEVAGDAKTQDLLGRLKVNDSCVVEAVCRGRVDDGISRGGGTSLEFRFHVNFADSRIVEVIPFVWKGN